jgi:glycosyltransferase involved in cell wall biosynthesis
VPSVWLKNLFITQGFSEAKIRVIPNPVPLDKFFPMDRSIIKKKHQLHQTEGNIILGFISASSLNDQRKGFDILEDSLLKLSPELLTRVKLLIAGKEFSSNEVDSRIAYIHYGNLKTETELNEYYNLCDAVVIPSRIDNFPQTATEAQASGCPVIISGVGGCRETVDDGKSGWVFNLDNDDLVSILSKILNEEKLLSEARKHAAIYSRERWNQEKIVKEYIAFQAELFSEID